MIVVLTPRPSRPTPPQCDRKVTEMWAPPSQFDNEYRRKKFEQNGRDPSRCQKTSKYYIDGENLCAFHGGIKAIDILLHQQGGPSCD